MWESVCVFELLILLNGEADIGSLTVLIKLRSGISFSHQKRENNLKWQFQSIIFLAVQNSLTGDLVTHSLTHIFLQFLQCFTTFKFDNFYFIYIIYNFYVLILLSLLQFSIFSVTRRSRSDGSEWVREWVTEWVSKH